MVAGGFLADGTSSPRVDLYLPDQGRWRRLPDLPVAVNHAMAAAAGGRLYVVGGVGRGGLARRMLALDPARRRWRSLPGPTPRQHLAVTAWRRTLYAVAGRLSGFASNLRLVEAYAPAWGSWRRLPPLPEPRGGTGAAVARGVIVSVGGEEPAGTIASVYGYDLGQGRWRRLPDLPTPRHGLGVAALRGRVYAVAGGTEPGLSVSAVNEVLDLG